MTRTANYINGEALSENASYQVSNLKVGEGNMASVYAGLRTCDGEVIAVKKFKSYGPGWEMRKNHIVTAYRITRDFRHRNIVQTYGLLSVGCNMMMLMEFVPRNLYEIVQTRALSPSDIESCFTQIVDGTSYMHSLGYAHRDLKLENVLVSTDGQVKIADLDTVTAGCLIRTSQVGSEPYMAPELFTESYHNPQVADVWSIAIIYVCMVFHRFPWMAARWSDVGFMTFFRMENQDSASSQDWLYNQIPIQHQNILRLMLELVPSKRSSLNQVSSWLAK